MVKSSENIARQGKRTFNEIFRDEKEV